jgi:anti-sigma factor RsiW
MTCKQFETRLHELEDYLDGRLDAAQRSQVELHLATCEACRVAIEDAPIAGRLLRAAFTSSAELPIHREAFVTTVRAQAAGAEQSQADFWRSLEALARRLAWTSVVAVALLSAIVIGMEAGYVAKPGRTAEVRELFPDPEPQPANSDEVFMVLASSGNGNK